MSRFVKWVIGIVIAALIVVAIGSQFMVRIGNGYVGVVFSPNGGIQEETLGQGWHPIGLFDKVTEYPIRLQTVEYKDVQTATSDGKNITIKNISFNYQVEQNKVIEASKTFGAITMDQIEDSYLRTRLADAARKSISKYSVIDIYGEKSSDAAADIQRLFSENIAKLGFVVSDLTLGVPTPDPKTQEAIDARVKASQDLERKTTELQIAQKEAERQKVEAQGIANAELIKAQGQAQANQVLQQSITDNLIKMEVAKNLKDIKFPAVLGEMSSIMNLPQEMVNPPAPKK
jgi:regulator of protease activity HflC (stomatin/prohibitin superfamily)